jgi:hypothetical protein
LSRELWKRGNGAEGGDPFLDVPGSLVAMADTLTRRVGCQESLTELRRLGVTGQVSAALDSGSAGPVLRLTVSPVPMTKLMRLRPTDSL